jgi:hypothetical protein
MKINTSSFKFFYQTTFHIKFMVDPYNGLSIKYENKPNVKDIKVGYNLIFE